MNPREDNQPDVVKTFFVNAPRNILLAYVTVPAEGMAVRRILYMHGHPHTKPAAYRTMINEIGFKGLFTGALSRTGYCLTGNFVNLLGTQYFGQDFHAAVATSLAKNMILPLFLFSNGQQAGLNLPQARNYLIQGLKDPYTHGVFFLRNLASHCCMLPGFWLRDYIYQANNEASTTLPNLAGYSASLSLSTIMNAYSKPYFTGAGLYNITMRRFTAARFPAKGALMLREAASMALVFFNSSPRKKQPKTSDEQVLKHRQ